MATVLELKKARIETINILVLELEIILAKIQGRIDGLDDEKFLLEKHVKELSNK